MEFNDRRAPMPPQPKLKAGRANLGPAFAEKVYNSKKSRQIIGKKANPYGRPQAPQPPK